VRADEASGLDFLTSKELNTMQSEMIAVYKCCSQLKLLGQLVGELLNDLIPLSFSKKIFRQATRDRL
jgi:hypothetical protein